MNLYTFSISLFLLSLFAATPCQGQSSWEQLANHPSSGIERMFSFEIDGLVYTGGGRISGGTNLNSFRAYDVSTDTWTSKASFPGDARRNAFGFAVNGKGYVGSGFNGAFLLNDFWEYDPVENSWSQLANFPGTARGHALALATDSKGYVLNGGGAGDNNFTNDMWEFDPATESWTALENFPGIGRWRTYGWIIDQKLYVGGGSRFPNAALNDFYRYDISTGSWNESQIATPPTNRTSGGFYFTIQGKGYYGEGSTGIDNNSEVYGTRLFVYDPVANSWEQEVSFIGQGRILGFSAVVDNQAIVGTGRQYVIGDYYRDVYSFTPEVVSSTRTTTEELELSLYPNPVSSEKLNIEGKFRDAANITFTLFDTKGSVQRLKSNAINPLGSSLIQIDVDHLPPGVYQLELNDNDLQRVMLRFIKQ